VDTVNPLAGLVASLRDRAAMFRTVGAMVDGEKLASLLADEIELTWRDHFTAPLTITEAARECGYTPDHLREMCRTGAINCVQPRESGHHRIRRYDLPRKAR
jgi:hypothetical protein